jgi:hypothetical protein
VEDVAGYLHPWVDEQVSASVGRGVCEAVADWWPRFPAVSELLEGPTWPRYRVALSLRFLRLHQGIAVGPPIEDYIDYVAATCLGSGRRREGLWFTMPEQQLVHLRYRLKLDEPAIAHVMDIPDRQTRCLWLSATSKLEDAVERDEGRFPDGPV